VARRIMSMKNSTDTIGNRNRDLPVWSVEGLILVLVELRSSGMMGEEVSGEDTFSALV
jgi:hypothetical protein